MVRVPSLEMPPPWVALLLLMMQSVSARTRVLKIAPPLPVVKPLVMCRPERL